MDPDYFKVTVHNLTEPGFGGGMLAAMMAQEVTPGSCHRAAAEMNEVRKTHLLVECKVISDGRGLVCVWVKHPPGENVAVPFGFKVV